MEEKKVNPNRLKKQQIVAKLSEKVTRAKGFVFTNYQGLTHKQLEVLKNKLKAANAELVVTKNTLLALALKVQSSKFKVQSSIEGPTATLFLYGDSTEPLRQLAKTIRELNLPTVKLGIIDGKNLTSEQILSLAALPPYNVLITQLLFQMKAPLYGLHRALSWNIKKLVMTLKAIQKTKVS